MDKHNDERWSRNAVWAWVAWALASVGVFALLEWNGLRKDGDEVPPLTHVIQRYVPAWLFLVAFGGFAVWFIPHILGVT